MVFTVLPAIGQIKLDTLYYDKNWKIISMAAFASYYRIIGNTSDTTSSKPYRNYYFTGELQGEGEYITIDLNDDKNSVFNGDYETFYKSGKTAEKGSWNRGKREGEFTTYNEDGLIEKHLYYSDGELDGVCTEFSEDGRTCVQTEYSKGQPRYDYYVISNSDGQCSKVSLSDGKPVYEEPTPSDLKVGYIDNDQWTFCNKNGIEVATLFNNWDLRISLSITNNSMFPIDIHEEDLQVSFENAKNGKIYSIRITPFARFSQIAERNANWDSFINAFAESWATRNAGRSSSQTTTAYAGTTGGKLYAGNTVSVTNSYDATAAYQARITASNRISSYNESLNNEVKIAEAGYLKNTTLNPGATLIAFVKGNWQRNIAGIFTVNFNINGVTYSSKWNLFMVKLSMHINPLTE